jgi:hypothetical protein
MKTNNKLCWLIVLFCLLFMISCQSLGNDLVDMGLGAMGIGTDTYKEGVNGENQKKQKAGIWTTIIGGATWLLGKLMGGKSSKERGVKPPEPVPMPDLVNKEKEAEILAKKEEIKIESEKQRQEIIANFEAYEKTLPIGTSSVTSQGEQNIGNPQVNNLAAKNGFVIPSNSRQGNSGGRSQGTGAQRTGGNVTTRPQKTTRDAQSANPNAANNTESRRDGANGSLDYTKQQSTGINQQKTTVTVQPVTETTIARVAVVQQQTPQIQAETIAEFTPKQTQTAIITQSPRQNDQTQIITPSPIDTPVRKGGYVYKDENIRISCGTLSPVGKQILLAIDEVAKELNVTIVITDGDRPLEQQLFYLLERQESYPGSTSEFKKEFGKLPPRTISELTTKQKEWYQQRIEDQAGRTPGFSHVGGNAVDIRVSDFSINGKRRLVDLFNARGVKILYEIPPAYNVLMNNATVFHLYK